MASTSIGSVSESTPSPRPRVRRTASTRSRAASSRCADRALASDPTRPPGRIPDSRRAARCDPGPSCAHQLPSGNPLEDVTLPTGGTGRGMGTDPFAARRCLGHFIHPPAAVQPGGRVRPLLPGRLRRHVPIDAGENVCGAGGSARFHVRTLRGEFSHASGIAIPELRELARHVRTRYTSR